MKGSSVPSMVTKCYICKTVDTLKIFSLSYTKKIFKYTSPKRYMIFVRF